MFKSKTTDFPQVLKQGICTFEVYEYQTKTAHWVVIRMEGNETSLFWFHIHCCDFKTLPRKSSIGKQGLMWVTKPSCSPSCQESQGRSSSSKHILARFLLPWRSPSLLLYGNHCLSGGTAHNHLSFPTSIKCKGNPWQPCPWANLRYKSN